LPQIDPVILRLGVDLRNYQAGLSQAQRLSDKSFSAIASNAQQAGQSIRDAFEAPELATKMSAELKKLLDEIDPVIGRINDSTSGSTAREKRGTALELVDQNFGRRHAEIQKAYNTAIKNKDANGIADARARFALLQELERLARLEVALKHQSPLEKRRHELTLTKAELEETFEQLGVKGLQTLEDGLFNAIRGVKELGDVFKDVANQIIADLLRIAIRQAIIKPLANLISGSGISAATLARLKPDVEANIAANPSIFASGGYVSGPGTGTSDSIAARLSNGEFVMSAAAVRRIGVDSLDRLNSFGRASGGYVSPGHVYRINEAASPGRVEGFIPQAPARSFRSGG
jgi:hypothetical protein